MSGWTSSGDTQTYQCSSNPGDHRDACRRRSTSFSGGHRRTERSVRGVCRQQSKVVGLGKSGPGDSNRVFFSLPSLRRRRLSRSTKSQ